MPTALRDRDVVTESWLATDALRMAQVRRPSADVTDDALEFPADPYTDPTPTSTPASTKVYPKRSELRRAEARSGRRTGGALKPGQRDGARRPGSQHGPSSHGPSSTAPIIQGRRGTQPAAQPAHPPRARRSSRSVLRDEPTRPIMAIRTDQVVAGQLPMALGPTPAVLPIPHLDDETRPAGLNLALPRQSDVFGRTASPPTVPIAVPMPGRSPERRSASAGTVDGAVDDLERSYDLERSDELEPSYDLERSDDLSPATRRSSQGRSSQGRSSQGRSSQGRRRIGAARMLVLAMVVSAEGVALTQMAGTPHLGRSGTADLTGSLSASAVLADAADRQASAETAQHEAVTMADAQTESGAGKVAAAMAQAKAAADRVQAAEERRDQVLRNAQRDPQSVARLMAADRGWGGSQFSCLESLWNRESGWNYQAQNSSSGAYGIPQALPGSKMGSVAGDWRTNPVTQIKWGLNYIADRYGTPCGAWGHSESVGWY